MRSDPLAGFPQFAQFLSTYPEPDDVAEALTLGPLAPLSPRYLSVFARVPGTTPPLDDELSLIGSYDVTDEMLERYGRVPLSLDIPLTEAVREGRLILVPPVTMIDDYKPLELDRPIWNPIVTDAAISLGNAVSMPASARGRSIGAVAFFTATAEPVGEVERRILELVGSLVGMWLTERSRSRRAGRSVVSGATRLLSLSDRQVSILRLIEAGASNSAIAVTLGYSVSTVKQEIHRMNAALRTTDRSELLDRARELDLYPPIEASAG